MQCKNRLKYSTFQHAFTCALYVESIAAVRLQDVDNYNLSSQTLSATANRAIFTTLLLFYKILSYAQFCLVVKICCQASAIMNLYVFWLSRGENSWFIYNKDICLSREGANSLVWMRYYGQLICCANLSRFMSFFREAATFWVKEGLGSYFSGKNCLTVLIIYPQRDTAMLHWRIHRILSSGRG